MNEKSKGLVVAIALISWLLSAIIVLIIGIKILIWLFSVTSVKADASPKLIIYPIESEPAPVESECVEIEEEHPYLIEVTQEDIDLLARVVMSEASVLDMDAKQAICQTIINRVRDDKYEFRNQNTVSDVVYHKNAYSTQDNGEPNADCYIAVEQALRYETFPTDMFYFREGHYHNFGTDYINIYSTYFSRK